MYFKFLLALWLCPLVYAYGQTKVVSGEVTDQQGKPIPYANVFTLDKSVGNITDGEGRFSLEVDEAVKVLVVSVLGYRSDTVDVHALNAPILLQKDEVLQEVEVKGDAVFLDEFKPQHTETLTERELLKAPCCNLSESFETNAAVDVNFSDAITGAKQIRLLGLDGKYVQIQRENIPLVRGLTSRYGLNYVPGTYLQSIDIGLGAGSVVNGYESMTGQINLEFKKPSSKERLYLNYYLNSIGRNELNVNTSQRLNERWSTAVLGHADITPMAVDRNGDGYMDVPKSRQLNLLNRWKYQGKRIEGQIGAQIMQENRVGGETGFGWQEAPLESSQFGYTNLARRAEVFGKTGILFPEKPHKGIGIIYSGAYHEMDLQAGRKSYLGSQRTLYVNSIYQTILGNSFHKFRTGLSYTLDNFEEDYADGLYVQDTNFQRTEHIPGVFGEYAYSRDENFIAVVGMRLDAHNIFGILASPRSHLKWKPAKKTSLRLSIGKGYRTPNALAENPRVFVSGAEIVQWNELRPEESWNYGLSARQEFTLQARNASITGTFFRTDFQNMLVVDMDQDITEVRFYNLDGIAFAHASQVEFQTEVTDRLSAKAAYKWYDVHTTINGELRELPFVSRHRFFLNASYATSFDKWTADATLQCIGPKRIPNTQIIASDVDYPTLSPSIVLLNAQISRGFRWGNIYLGGENLLNTRQEDPILNPSQPFSENFNANLAWGPIVGRMIFVGFRYKIKSE